MRSERNAGNLEFIVHTLIFCVPPKTSTKKEREW